MIDPTAPKFWPNLIAVLVEGAWETIYMTAIAMAITFVVGLPLGIILVGTEQGRFLEAPLGSRALGRAVNELLGFIVNLGRSVPFIVLMIALIPITRWLLGSFIGTGPAIVPLTLVAIPFFVRVVEIAVREVEAVGLGLEPERKVVADADLHAHEQQRLRIQRPQPSAAQRLGHAPERRSVLERRCGGAPADRERERRRPRPRRAGNGSGVQSCDATMDAVAVTQTQSRRAGGRRRRILPVFA